MDKEKTRLDALAFLKRNTTGVLATAGHDNIPHASAIHYYADENFNLYFFTLPSSRKYKALAAHPQVAFTVLREDTPQTIQIEGMAKDITNDLDAADKKIRALKALESNPFFVPPVDKLNKEPKVLVWIRPTWIRWEDYAFAKAGSENILQEIEVRN